jgi:hypothetical protein
VATHYERERLRMRVGRDVGLTGRLLNRELRERLRHLHAGLRESRTAIQREGCRGRPTEP